MNFFGIAAVLFIVPFGVALLIPGWRSMAWTGVVAAVLLALIFIALSQSTASSIGNAVLMLFVFFAAGGLLAGMALRAAILAFSGKKKAR